MVIPTQARSHHPHIASNENKSRQESITKDHTKKFKDDMMKLLIASMKNVNPLQQTDAAASMNMASMLIAVEQGQAQVDAMERLENSTKEINQNLSQYAALLGSEVLVESDKVILNNGVADFNFKIKNGVQQPVFEIFTPDGEIVFSEHIKPTTTQLSWNGILGKDKTFYDDLRVRIIDADNNERQSVSDKLAHYVLVNEIVDNESGEKHIKNGDIVVPISQITAVKRNASPGTIANLENPTEHNQFDTLLRALG